MPDAGGCTGEQDYNNDNDIAAAVPHNLVNKTPRSRPKNLPYYYQTSSGLGLIKWRDQLIIPSLSLDRKRFSWGTGGSYSLNSAVAVAALTLALAGEEEGALKDGAMIGLFCRRMEVPEQGGETEVCAEILIINNR